MTKILEYTATAKGYHKVERRDSEDVDDSWGFLSYDSPYEFKVKVTLEYVLGKYRVFVGGAHFSKHRFFISALESFERAKVHAEASVRETVDQHNRVFLRINNVPQYAWPWHIREM